MKFESISYSDDISPDKPKQIQGLDYFDEINEITPVNIQT